MSDSNGRPSRNRKEKVPFEQQYPDTGKRKAPAAPGGRKKTKTDIPIDPELEGEFQQRTTIYSNPSSANEASSPYLEQEKENEDAIPNDI
jgi:hypothetical protein